MRFIHEHRDQFAVALLLRVLNITASTYYGWLRQAAQPCDRGLVDRGLLSNIHEVWEASGRTYRLTGSTSSYAVTASASVVSASSG